jgi:sortase A
MATQRVATQTPSNAWGPLPPHAVPRGPHRGWRWLERILLAVAMVSLGYYGYATIESYLYQAVENRELDNILRSAPAPVLDSASTVRRRPPVARGGVIGRIEIPRLGVSSVMRAGTDARTLRLSVGHIPGTAYPGEPGNVGLAGHRDTFFRRLRDIRSDDVIRLVTPQGTFTYRVERTNIVNPHDVWVLEPTRQPALTLVTCYPFTYVGSAPQRFIVRAQLDAPAVRATLAP